MDLSNGIDIAIKVFTPILTIVSGLMIYIWTKQEKKIDKIEIRMKKVEDDIIDFRFNYKDQFRTSNEKNTTQHEEIKEKNAVEHTEIKILLAKICANLGIE